MTPPKWPDARGWIGIGVFGISVMLLWMIAEYPELRRDEFFQTIATVIISNGLMAVIAWAYAATKGGGELADRNANLVEKVAQTTADTAAVANAAPAVQEVKVVNPPEDPANVVEAPPVWPKAEEELPEYAR